VVQSEPASTLIVHTAQASSEDRRRLREAGVELVELRTGDDGRIDLEALLDHLARKEVATLLIEGGPTVHGSFHDADLIDEIAIFVAPFLIGGAAPATVAGQGIPTLDMARRFHFEVFERRGTDLEIRAIRLEDADVHGAG
jgi:diaminohydroxyphosphoribosylaminopyrimidine deaminase/5-amino-6-(5-phosphoribosylamino)uracil reductase